MTQRIAAEDDFREMLKQSTELLSEVRWGQDGFLERVSEMMGNYPGGSGNGSQSKGSHSDPTSSAAGKRDDVAADWSEARRAVKRVYDASRALKQLSDRYSTPTTAPPKMKDPGCELCNDIAETLTRMKAKAPGNPDDFTNYWSESYCAIDDISQTNSKGEHPKVRVCYWCYRFSLPKERGGAARLPNIYELVAHAQGRRVMRSA